MEKVLKKLKSLPRRQAGRTFVHEIVLAILAVSYFSYFTIATFLKYGNYYTGRFDLGNMAQTVWNTIHGRIFLLTDPNGTEEISRLAFHADFILILLSPFYLIWEDPRMLLLIQTAILSVGGIFVYLISKHVLSNKTISLVLALSFYLNPAVNYTNLFDFHGVTLATTFFLAAFYFILKSNYKPAILFLILAGITKEQTWIIVTLFGLYLVFINKQKALGLSIFAFSSLIFYFLIWQAIPSALGSQHFATQFFRDFGDSPTEIIKSIFLHPVQTIQTLFMPDRLSYIKQLFMPLGYLSFIGIPFLILATPDLIINLLSGSPQMHQIYYQYSATITPFIFISAAYAVPFIRKRFPEVSFHAISAIILIFSILSAYTYGPLPFAKKPTDAMFRKPLAEKNTIDKYLSEIPLNEKISATNNLGSHLSHRRHIFVIPLGMDKADRIIFLVKQDSSQKEKDTLIQIQNDPDFSLEFNEGNFYVFKKIAP